MKRSPGRARFLAPLACLTLACGSSSNSHSTTDAGPPDARGTGKDAAGSGVVAVKVMIVNMDILEAAAFTQPLGLKRNVPVAGLPPMTSVQCNDDDVCEVLTGMGYANAASSMTALLHGGRLDLTRAYFVIAGIAGIDPLQGTVASAAWARYVVDIGLSHEIDAREMPSGWPYGYFGLGATSPAGKPSTRAGTEVYQLDEDLLQQAYALSKDVKLNDDAASKAYRAHYPSAPANQPPTVLQCDVASGDTWFAGPPLTQRARDWTKLMTEGKGVFCMSAEEDNASLTALTRAAQSGRVDMHRVAVLRSASDMSDPYPGLGTSDGLVNYLSEGGLTTSAENLYVAAKPLITAIVHDWATWQNGPPAAH